MFQEKIRVLVVDDAATYRRIMRDALGADPQIEVVGSAPNGKIALEKIGLLRPDVVTLDVEMPEMDGLETLKVLRRRHPEIRTIMVSGATQRGAATTIEALSFGAFDFVSKPNGSFSYEENKRRLREDLIRKVKQCAVDRGAGGGPRGQRPPSRSRRTVPLAPILFPRDVVLIGVSTGGPDALVQLIPKLPVALRAGVLIVQHMPPLFTAHLATRLNHLSALAVKEAEEGEPVRPGQVLIAPGGSHMVVDKDRGRRCVRLTDDPPENSCRPAVDPLFRSAARVYGSSALAVVLTGMGADGFKGAQALREKGAYVLTQDAESCVVYGMPKAVVEAGLADKVLPLDLIADEIIRQVKWVSR